MDLKALRYFVATVRHSSFTLAAAELCVTQSTVSKMVRQLEEQLDQTLLIREGRGVRLTDAGAVVYARGQEALAVVKRLNQDMAHLNDRERGELVLGIPPMVNLFFPALIKRFKDRYPNIQLHIEEAGGQIIEQRVKSGDLEVGVSLLPLPDQSGLAFTEVGDYPICLIGGKNTAWARTDAPTLAHLRHEPLLMYSDDFALAKRLKEGFIKAGIQPIVSAQSGQWDFLMSMALAGLGTAFIPQPLLRRIQLPEQVVIRTLHEPDLSWRVGLVWVPDRYLSHAARAWLSLCAPTDDVPFSHP